MLFRQYDRYWLAQAPAKVNLFLRVTGKRPDGYHGLETVMACVTLWDSIWIEPVADATLTLRVRCAYPPELQATPIPESSENLVLRAAELLRQHSGYSGGARLTLVKRIPAAAGLGGGSSDAAATLAVLNRAWQLQRSRRDLMQLASELGSDVPFFLAPSTWALCTGRGELVEPLAARARLWMVVARPPTGLSTAAVYRTCQIDHDHRAVEPFLAAVRQGDTNRTARLLRNSLQPAAEALNADVVRLKEEFGRLPVCGHQLTGSGSAYFGVCRNRRQAAVCAARLKSRGLGAVWTVSTC